MYPDLFVCQTCKFLTMQWQFKKNVLIAHCIRCQPNYNMINQIKFFIYPAAPRKPQFKWGTKSWTEVIRLSKSYHVWQGSSIWNLLWLHGICGHYLSNFNFKAVSCRVLRGSQKSEWILDHWFSIIKRDEKMILKKSLQGTGEGFLRNYSTICAISCE